MCGRFTLTVELITIVERFLAPMPILEWKARYNIAPTQPCLTVVSGNGGRSIVSMSWGLIPHSSKDRKSAYSHINARAETVATKPTFRELFKRRRCLVPADGFFEWRNTPEGKIPFRATLKEGGLFAFAGLWDEWKSEVGESVKSFTILTTEANSVMRPVHDRMPVILRKEAEEKWLDASLQDSLALERYLLPYSDSDMKLYEVSTTVNSWKNESIECILPR